MLKTILCINIFLAYVNYTTLITTLIYVYIFLPFSGMLPAASVYKRGLSDDGWIVSAETCRRYKTIVQQLVTNKYFVTYLIQHAYDRLFYALLCSNCGYCSEICYGFSNFYLFACAYVFLCTPCQILKWSNQGVGNKQAYDLHRSWKGKAIPVQAWTGLEGSMNLRLPDFKTVGTWRWWSGQPYAPASFTSQ
jgi:hypothetical protein